MIFSPASPIEAEEPPLEISPNTTVPACRTALMHEGGLGLRDSFLADCEACEGDPCFFSCMGERARERLGA